MSDQKFQGYSAQFIEDSEKKIKSFGCEIEAVKAFIENKNKTTQKNLTFNDFTSTNAAKFGKLVNLGSLKQRLLGKESHAWKEVENTIEWLITDMSGDNAALKTLARRALYIFTKIMEDIFDKPEETILTHPEKKHVSFEDRHRGR